MTLNTIPVGSRVRVTDGGPGFVGLTGTVTGISDEPRHALPFYTVEFDNPPSADVRVTGDPHGGPWQRERLEVLATPPYVVGQKIRFRETRNPRGFGPFDAGQVVTVAAIHADDNASDGWVVDLAKDATDADGEDLVGWGVAWFEPVDNGPGPVEEPAKQPERPFIDFSGDRYATAREYASFLRSKVNKPQTNADLLAVADGLQVDAYSLNESVLDAMRHCATRFGQSMARREATKRAAYLGHIVQAVLENHADGLPTYEQGARSRKIEDLTAEVDRLKLLAAERANERADLTDAAAEERRRLVAEIETLKGAVQVATENLDATTETLDRAVNLAEERDRLLTDVVAERDRLSKSLDYALGYMPTEARERVLGFIDGLSQD